MIILKYKVEPINCFKCGYLFYPEKSYYCPNCGTYCG